MRELKRDRELIARELIGMEDGNVCVYVWMREGREKRMR